MTLKSFKVQAILQLVDAFFKDVSAAYPGSSREFEKDYLRLQKSVMSRGVETLLRDLPTVADAILFLEENGSLPDSGFLLKAKSKTDPRPRFLYGLWSRVMDLSGHAKKDADPTAFFFLRMTSFFKKCEVQCSDFNVDKCIEEYYEIEKSLVPPSLDWEDPLSPYSPVARNLSFRLYDDESGNRPFFDRLDKVSGILSSALGEFLPLSDECKGRHGKGSVADYYHLSKMEFPLWPAKLEGIFPSDWMIGSLSRDTVFQSLLASSRLIAVPKTIDKPRLVASEPIANMWCQQAISDFLNRPDTILRRFFDSTRQDRSRAMVRRGSRDGSLATIDLSSASDRVTCAHIERLFRSNASILSALMAVRTPVVFDRRTNCSTRILKFAAQGSAVTFPVQSIFFLAVALAALGAYDRTSIEKFIGEVRTFGDDIIVPNDGYEKVAYALTILGLKVNEKKSFHRGRFRESCGMDAFEGYDVTPLKPKIRAYPPTAPLDVETLFDCANNLFKKGCWHMSKELDARLVPILGPQVISSQREASNHVFSFSAPTEGVISSHVRVRWNKSLQRHDVLIRRPFAKVKRIRIEGEPALFRFWNSDYSWLSPRRAEEPGRISRVYRDTWTSKGSCQIVA